MTNHPNPNSAAQAPEPKTVLTADELKASSPFQWLGRRYTPEVAERLLREFESVLLSKLRAPVSDIREGFELTYAADADDPACASDLSHFTNGWQACIASQVRAPVADERATKALNRIERRASDDQRQRDLDDLTVVRDALQSSHVSDERELRAAAQATCDALKTVARFAVESLDDRDALVAASIRLRAALASAPVAGEAVYTLRVRGAIQAWTPTAAAFSIPDGEHQLFLCPAAPQPSAEPARILFPSHLRKMWSGGEVQAWLDQHQGVTPPPATAKGSLARYRQWKAEQDQAAAPCTCPSGDGSLHHPCPAHPRTNEGRA